MAHYLDFAQLLKVYCERCFLCHLSKLITPVVFLSLSIIFSSCDLFYDPVRHQDVPISRGSTWNKVPIIAKQTTDRPYDASDLSGSMSLPFLLDMALYNNPATRVSWSAARASAYAYRVSLSPYYPSIAYTGTLDAQTNKGSTLVSTGDVSGAVTTGILSRSTYQTNDVTLNYLLLDFGGRSAGADFARWALYASNWQHDFTIQQVMLSVLNAYTAYLGNKSLVIAYKQDLEDAKVALKAAEVMHMAGLATLSDVLSAQSTVEQTLTNFLQAQGSENTSLGQILIAVGLPPDANISIDQLPRQLPVIEIAGDISCLLELAKKRRPDLGVAIAAIKQQEATLAQSYSNSLPSLSVLGQWHQVRFFQPKKPIAYSELASLELNAPIFQGFYYLNQQRQLRAQIDQALANLDVQVAVVSSQVLANYYAWKTAESALPSARAAVEYAERAYRGLIVQYKTGTASILNVLTALTSLSNARSQEVVIRTQWAASLANLSFSVGVLEPSEGAWKEAPSKKLYEIPIKDDH